jgi:xanthine/CO dehydrogenase XdhC/CoxF family maturation factor
MDNTDPSVPKSCIQWIENGHQVAVATVVETRGSTPRPVTSERATPGAAGTSTVQSTTRLPIRITSP